MKFLTAQGMTKSPLQVLSRRQQELDITCAPYRTVRMHYRYISSRIGHIYYTMPFLMVKD